MSKPNALTLVGPVHTTLHKLTALARKGYLATGLELYPATGQMVVTMETGCPDAALAEAVEADMAEALAIQEAQRQRDIEAAAARLVEDRARAERKAEMAAKVAEAAATLAALQAAEAAA
jgi:acyl CoA:acetate/3-ketoacid CoA transferase alpha subunit